MKKLITLLFALTAAITFSQKVTHDQVGGIAKKGSYKCYTSIDSTTYCVGDRVSFGMPSGVNGRFIYVDKMDVMGTMYIVGKEAVNTSAEIKKIKVGGNKRMGYKVYFQTKGTTGIDNYFFPIEDAKKSGEIL